MSFRSSSDSSLNSVHLLDQVVSSLNYGAFRSSSDSSLIFVSLLDQVVILVRFL